LENEPTGTPQEWGHLEGKRQKLGNFWVRFDRQMTVLRFTEAQLQLAQDLSALTRAPAGGYDGRRYRNAESSCLT
jgi:hypothetical protein